MLVTAYVVTPDNHCTNYPGKTASGVYAHRGTVAADIRRYPFGTHLYIPGYGLGTVRDTGGYINGNHIDVAVTSCREATNWGAKYLKVTVYQ
jgi:3D (Asp-Asp-Asp) domain-containing protein